MKQNRGRVRWDWPTSEEAVHYLLSIEWRRHRWWKGLSFWDPNWWTANLATKSGTLRTGLGKIISLYIKSRHAMSMNERRKKSGIVVTARLWTMRDLIEKENCQTCCGCGSISKWRRAAQKQKVPNQLFIFRFRNCRRWRRLPQLGVIYAIVFKEYDVFWVNSTHIAPMTNMGDDRYPNDICQRWCKFKSSYVVSTATTCRCQKRLHLICIIISKLLLTIVHCAITTIVLYSSHHLHCFF